MPPARTIQGHHDFGVLEARLAALVREAKSKSPRGPCAPVLIVAPTRRLLAHLRIRLAGAFPALLNVTFLHHDALAREAADAAGVVLPRALADGVKEAILGFTIEWLGGDLARYAASRPGMLAALRRTIDDLREAGIDPAEAAEVPGLSRQGGEALRVYAAYASRLAALSEMGLTDRAGRLAAALPHVPDYAARFDIVIHYGAYELIGTSLSLLKAVEASGARVVLLVPFHPSSPAFAYARRFWPEMLQAEPAPLAGSGAANGLLAPRIPLLYDETAPPPPSSSEAGGPPRSEGRALELFHAQGAEAELREVALRVLRAHRDLGIPLRETVVIARTLEPYAALLSRVFGEHGLPFVTSATRPARGEARVLAALQLARCALGDFPRQPLFDLGRSGLARMRGEDPAGPAHGWDRLSRDWGVAGGLETWTRELPRWVEAWRPHIEDDADEATRERAIRLQESRLRLARSLAAYVEELERASRPLVRADSFAAWADGLERLAERMLAAPSDGDAGAGVIRAALAALRDLDAADLPFAPASALAFFDRMLSGAVVPIEAPGDSPVAGGGDNGGVRILDAMQARGLAFDAVFLIGFNADLFPRRPREDPFLPDEDRLLLRRRLLAPLPIKSGSREEEHLLLAHLLGSARRSLTISWQRADEEGRARVPSLALREVARLAFGAADLDRAIERAERVETDCGRAGTDVAGRLGLISPREASLSIAVGLRSPGRLRDTLPLLPLALGEEARAALADGLRLLEIIEDPAGRDLRFDARVGEGAPPPAVWSPSRLEALGTCAQSYFFRHVLRVEELEEPVEGFEIDAAEIGRAVHEVLHETYRGLVEAGDLSGGPLDLPPVVEKARRLAGEAWTRRSAALRGRMRRRFPLLWETTSALWLQAIDRFLEDDLGALAAAGAAILGTEAEIGAPLALGSSGRTMPVRGRLDRVVRRRSGEVVVSDYKTSGRLEDHVSMLKVLKGLRLQLPLYVLLAESRLGEWDAAGAPVRAEALGVGPSFDAEERRADLDPEKLGAHRAAFLETVSVLAELAAAGHFPLDRESRYCPVCPYVRACRRTHPATVERLAMAPEGRAYALLRRKTTRAPTLADAEPRNADAAEEA